jgi:peptidoglycan/xylan/chitin deacetylase (PgdA/CDA1 family)
VVIVTYHAVVAERSPISCTPEDLASDLERLREAGFTFVTLDDCADWLAGTRALPPRSAAVTFDDGYASVAGSALPILIAQRVPFTVFVIAGRLGKDNQWPGQWASVPRLPLIDRSALGEIVAAGACIAAHTFSHPVLTALDTPAVRRETLDAGTALEDLIGGAVRYFAYPYGLRGPREMDVARERYRLALNSVPAAVTASTDPFDVPRPDCHDVRLALRLRLTGNRFLPPY